MIGVVSSFKTVHPEDGILKQKLCKTNELAVSEEKEE
jgi:hypothetical protein